MADCQHPTLTRRACADLHLHLHVCRACGFRLYVPSVWPKPRLVTLKHALRLAGAMEHAGPPGTRLWYELPVATKDVPYLMLLLDQAGFATRPPDHAANLFVRARPGRAHHPPLLASHPTEKLP